MIPLCEATVSGASCTPESLPSLTPPQTRHPSTVSETVSESVSKRRVRFRASNSQFTRVFLEFRTKPAIFLHTESLLRGQIRQLAPV